jgi:dTDP-4-amino-4,6-dideoxygalactose transaminase
MPIPFNRPTLTAKDLSYIQEAAQNLRLSGNGPFTARCQEWLERSVGSSKALLTHSGTAALEMAALLCEVGPGDEVVMPSFTFASTANAFVLRGATPVFVDVQPDTLNMDPARVSEALTAATRAIVPVHYAGVGCDMQAITAVATAAKVHVIEDAAQALLSKHRGRPLGSFGSASALSFHETKNIISGEGGALLVNNPDWCERAEILWEKGTNRAAFYRGEVDKYTWCDVGSSFLPSEITAAFLWGQLERCHEITAQRKKIWHAYADAFAPLERARLLRCPVVPESEEHNAHIFFLLFPTAEALDAAIKRLRDSGIDAVRHYVPLHSSPAGRRYGRSHGQLTVTDDISARLVRLPLWSGMTEDAVRRVVHAVWTVVAPGERVPVA